MLEIHEILDRFELLYSDNTALSDLRRTYIDNDLNSLFRLLDNNNDLEFIDDVRKLVVEKNIWKLWPILDRYISTQFINAFKRLYVDSISYNKDCFSRGQLESKKWLIDIVRDLDVDLGIVYLCGGWYGTLATMIFESSISVDAIRSFDIDPTVTEIAEIFNKPWFIDNWKFKAITQDIHSINYTTNSWSSWSDKNNRMSNPITESPNTVINTSCEHIGDFDKWYDKIPKGKIVILQSNNYFDVPEHTNCSKSISEFADITPMTDVLYEGELLLEKYTRFMRIGYR